MKIAAFCLAALMSAAFSVRQEQSSDQAAPVFGGMMLLPGYACTPPSAIEGRWTISKVDGATIQYSGGNVANVVHSWVRDARRDGTAAWAKEQVIHGRTAEVAMTKDGHLLVSIAPFNFSARVDSIEHATDVLLTVLTYGDEDRRDPAAGR